MTQVIIGHIYCSFAEGIMGMAIVGGAALAIGGLVSLGIALTKK
jgi:hypothetical protein